MANHSPKVHFYTFRCIRLKSAVSLFLIFSSSMHFTVINAGNSSFVYLCQSSLNIPIKYCLVSNHLSGKVTSLALLSDYILEFAYLFYLLTFNIGSVEVVRILLLSVQSFI
ncbi:hypothetical protein OIU84_017222 [Salix udensis]|uniref:Uncharacterized protein n=1 Tax=Salix udensis TaxID=889485 RepID=A0AAD6L1G2_9ROSI|nr:hypothetical protein OIU84_017222 [Salix udensis]